MGGTETDKFIADGGDDRDEDNTGQYAYPQGRTTEQGEDENSDYHNCQQEAGAAAGV